MVKTAYPGVPPGGILCVSRLSSAESLSAFAAASHSPSIQNLELSDCQRTAAFAVGGMSRLM
jgi:hypothetical protein